MLLHLMIMGLAAAGMGMPMEMKMSRIPLHDPALIQHIEAFAGCAEKIPVMGDDQVGDIKCIEDINQPFPNFLVKIGKGRVSTRGAQTNLKE